MKNFIFFFGPPASGKGTQVELLRDEFDFKVLSVGKLLRKEKDEHSELGLIIDKYINKGRLVPDGVVEKVIDKGLGSIMNGIDLIFDGYPRNEEQLVFLDDRLKEVLKKGDRVCAIYINVGSKEIERRLGGRRSCKCGSTYHIVFNPPQKDGVCDNCEKYLFTRADDNCSVIKERISVFKSEFKPIVSYWRRRGVLIKINGERSIGTVQRDIKLELVKLGIIPS